MIQMDKKTSIQFEQMRQLFSASTMSLLSSIALATILAYAQRNVITPIILIAWLSAIALASLSRLALLKVYQYSPTENPTSIRHRMMWFRFFILLSGVVWGSTAILLFPDNQQHQLVLVVILVGLASGAVVSLSADLFCAMAFPLLVMLPLMIRLLASGDSLSTAIGTAIVLYLGFILVNSRRIHLNTHENIRLHLEAITREEAVRASEERYRLLLNHSPVGIFHYDTSFVITYCNNKLAEMLHSSTEMLIDLDLRHLNDQSILPALSTALSGNFGFYEGHYRATFSDADGWIQMTCAPVRNDTGESVGGIAIVQDITERKQAEQLISEQKEFLNTILESSPECVKVVAPNGKLLQMNQAGLSMLEVGTFEEAQQTGLLEFIAPEYRTAFTELHRNVCKGGSGILEFEIKSKSGAIKWLETHATPLRDASGQVVALLGVTRDITERKASEAAHLHSENRLKFMLETSPIAVRIAASGGRRVLFANQSYARLINSDHDPVIGRDPAGYYANPNDYEDILQTINGGQNVINKLVKLAIPGFGTKWALASYFLIEYECEPAVLGWFYDITELKLAEEKLSLSARVFAEAQEGITITDAQGTIVDVNPTFCEITGYNREEAIGKNPRFLSSGRQSPEFYAMMWKDLIENGYWKGEVWNRKKSGETYAELLTISALHDDQGQTMYYVGLFSDITHTKQQQQALELMAHYDVLTKLPNRALFADRFSQAVARAKREDTLLAVCFLDLDGFKSVNDTLGHETGDLLLIEVAERIKSTLREEDTISRFGGDEFALLLNEIKSIEQCELTLGRIHRAIAQPFYINGQSVTIAASSGVTLYPLDDDNADALLRHADQAMYKAKINGRNRYHLFDSTQDQQTQDRHQKLGAIEKALSCNELQLYYQPKVDIRSGEVLGAEALIRWIHPERGIIPPLEFLPLIEGSPLEISIGNWVIEEALKQMEIWRKAGLALQVSVNISPRHLQEPGFFAHLDTALSRHPGIPSQQLQLEVLESSVLNDLTIITEVIRACRDGLGVSIALDDFGTGYSSLTHLRHLPANTIKIDQTFVRDMIDDPNDFAIVAGVVGLADAFRREVIAEGVESQDHGLMLLTLGCNNAQGYGIARPMPASAVQDWVRSYIPDPKWLDYARKTHTPDETMVMLLVMENRHWVNRLEKCLNAPEGTELRWPIMNHDKCHSGRWTDHARKINLFDSALLSRIDEAHAELHRIGNTLMQMRHDGKIADARSGIILLTGALEKIEAMLNQHG